MNTSSTSVISSMPSMNFRTETTTSGLSVMMMTASSAKVEFSDAFADPITARLDHLRVQGRGGQDPNTLVHVVREGGRGGGMRPDRGLGGVDDQHVPGAQRKQGGCVLPEVADRRRACPRVRMARVMWGHGLGPWKVVPIPTDGNGPGVPERGSWTGWSRTRDLVTLGTAAQATEARCCRRRASVRD